MAKLPVQTGQLSKTIAFFKSSLNISTNIPAFWILVYPTSSIIFYSSKFLNFGLALRSVFLAPSLLPRRLSEQAL